jgi:CcmD family protein
MRVAPEGVIIGGWSFVVAAYGVTAVVLVGYAWSLRSRLNRTQQRMQARDRDHG